MIPSMKIIALLNFVATLSIGNAAPILKREVPQGMSQHSHEKFLTSVRASLALKNPDKIADPVFGLLGNAAAAGGAGDIKDLDCLHQATADQAFTNAKASGNVQGMVDALIYAALERNTGKVGLASVLCTSVTAKNPEIAAITQHQDPASTGAAAGNKAIVLALAKQIKSVGGDPQQALESGTFAPGNLNDATAKGNTCDDANDPEGCIFTQNLLVPDATAADIDAAVGGAASNASASTTVAASVASSTDSAIIDATAASSTCSPAATVTVTMTMSNTASTTAAASASTSSAVAVSSSANQVAVSTGSFDFGSCSNPAIEFGLGFDGRKDNSFEPENKNDFNHGSALNIKVIADFICQQLNDKCKASASTIAACLQGETAAIALGSTGSAADTFNAALGIQTNFAANPLGGAAALATKAAAVQNAVVTTTTAAAAATTTAASSASASTSGNLQTFKAGLGGITPPAVTKTGSSAQPFCVDGNACFSSLSNALTRSCDVQHNKCANFANAAGQKPPFSVDDCQTQQNTCDTAHH